MRSEESGARLPPHGTESGAVRKGAAASATDLPVTTVSDGRPSSVTAQCLRHSAAPPSPRGRLSAPFHSAGAENCAPFTHGKAEEDPLSHLLPRSGGKCQLPLQARGAKVAATDFHSVGAENLLLRKRYHWSGDTTPQSFRLVNKPKSQLPPQREPRALPRRVQNLPQREPPRKLCAEGAQFTAAYRGFRGSVRKIP